MGKQTGRFAIAAVIAAAAGYVAGVLTAPKSGKETRQDIKDATNKKITEFEKQLKQKHTELNTLLNDAGERINKVKGSAKEDLEQLTTRAMQAKDKVRIALSGVRDGESSDKDLQKAIDDAQKAIDHLRTYMKKQTMFIFGNKQEQKTKPDKKKTIKEYEQMGRELEALYWSVHPNRSNFYKAAFLRGILGGVGGVIGATVVIALVLWLLSLFNDVPLIGGFVDAIRRTIESGPPAQ